MHSELNKQNKALLERVRELVEAGEVKETRIRELEAQNRSLQGNHFNRSYSDITLYSLAAEQLTLCAFDICRSYSKGRYQPTEIEPNGIDQEV